MKNREPRFPGIDWYCDNCNAYLNTQPDFDDHHYVWKCKICGYKSSISRANITFETISHENYILGFILGILRTAIACLVIVLILNVLMFNAHIICPDWLLPVLITSYIALDIFSMYFERCIVKYGQGKKLLPWIICSVFVYLWGDVTRPVTEPIIMIRSLIKSIKPQTRFLYNLPKILSIGLTYLVILSGVIITIIWICAHANPTPLMNLLSDLIYNIVTWLSRKG